MFSRFVSIQYSLICFIDLTMKSYCSIVISCKFIDLSSNRIYIINAWCKDNGMVERSSIIHHSGDHILSELLQSSKLSKMVFDISFELFNFFDFLSNILNHLNTLYFTINKI